MTYPRRLRALVLAALLAPRAATAQHGPAPRANEQEQAEARFRLAREHYRAGRFADALAVLLELRQRFRDPVLSYDLARVYEGLGDREHALNEYEEYLRAEPNAADRGAIERRVVTLRAEIAERKRLEAESRRAPPPPPPPQGPGVWPFVVAGAGVVALAGGVTFALLARGSESAARDEPRQTRASDLLDRARTEATVANVAFVAGAILAAAGVLWWALAPRATGIHASFISPYLGDARTLR